jgi:CSLREA domain-containing protein
MSGHSRQARLGFALTAVLAVLALALVPAAGGSDNPGATITVTSTADATGGPNCTLRDAITAANTDTATGGCSAGNGADTIDFGVSGQINLGSTLPAMTSALAIDASGRNIVVSGQGAVRVLEVDAGASLTLHQLRIADGNTDNGGGILNAGTLSITNSTLSGNVATDHGGAISNAYGGSLIVRASTLSGNVARYDETDYAIGGGIYNDGRALVENSTLSHNTANSGGGAIDNHGVLTVRDSVFEHNYGWVGGAIENPHGTVKIANSTFSGNDAYDAGAIGNGGALVVARSTFSGNHGDNGGAIGSGGWFTIVESGFSDNRAYYGGAIYAWGSVFTIVESTFADNYAGYYGGALWVGGSGWTAPSSGILQRSTFTLNRAGAGGAAIETSGQLSSVNSTFAGNTTNIEYGGGPGGAVDNFGTFTAKSSTFVGNSSSDGGAIANEEYDTAIGRATFENSIVAGNSEGGNCSGTFEAASSSNMSDDSTCGPGFTQVSLADLMLGPLADNGGPTQTIALGPGSVAIDAGDNSAAECLGTDQRGPGYPRIVNGRVDIGAFEVQRPQPVSRKTTCSALRPLVRAPGTGTRATHGRTPPRLTRPHRPRLTRSLIE